MGIFATKEEGSGAESGVVSPSPLGKDSAGPKLVFDSVESSACHPVL